MNWPLHLATNRQAIWPSEPLMRFIGRTYGNAPDRSKVRFLDIGSGKHAPNTHALTLMGYDVIAIDFAPGALAHERADIRASGLFNPETFDCVLDINTLCHVENPPIKAIRDWLKPGGKFYSIAPHVNTSRGHLEGKGYCRCADHDSIKHLMVPFGDKWVNGYQDYRDPGRGEIICSWIIEATK